MNNRKVCYNDSDKIIVNPKLVYVRNLDSLRANGQKSLFEHLQDEGISSHFIYYYCSLGRFCTEFAIEESYSSKFASLILQISKKYNLSEIYALRVDFQFNQLYPNCYDFEQVKPKLPSKAKKILYKHSQSMLVYRMLLASHQAHNLTLKVFFIKNFIDFLPNIDFTRLPSIHKFLKTEVITDDLILNFPYQESISELIKYDSTLPKLHCTYNPLYLSHSNTVPNNSLPPSNIPSPVKFFKNSLSPTKPKNIISDGFKANAHYSYFKNNWSSITVEQINEIVPTPSNTRLIAYTDGAFVSQSPNKDYGITGIGIYFDPPLIPCIYQKVSFKKSSAYAELFSITTALQTLLKFFTKAKTSSSSQTEITPNTNNPTYSPKNFSSGFPSHLNISQISEIWIISDSRYAIDGINLNFPNWLSNSGKNKKGSRISNFAEFCKISSLSLSLQALNFSLYFHYLPSHSGILGNEAADLLARAATLS
ncbi:hypothetical protein AYI70_g1718 [Smittium culicis]|uniref:ribonuclease H n=1 Tax=Smittium culicis TaxID=133412 RepID=A0A1R1YBI0_9FUNG|nr:hypothetical protein AYI70_g1718 [Smittium culicis]